MADADRCICCGEIIPEGRMVCPQCERSTDNKYINTLINRLEIYNKEEYEYHDNM